MLVDPVIYKQLNFIVTAAPFAVALVIYFCVLKNIRSLVRYLLLYLVCVCLFFLSLYLFAYNETAYPAVRLWIVQKNGKSFRKKEMVAVFKTPYTFQDGSVSIIEPSDLYAVINNTDKRLIAESVIYSTCEPDDIRITGIEHEGAYVMPHTVHYMPGLDYFGYGKDGPPQKKWITVEQVPYSETLGVEKNYWVRW